MVLSSKPFPNASIHSITYELLTHAYAAVTGSAMVPLSLVSFVFSLPPALSELFFDDAAAAICQAGMAALRPLAMRPYDDAADVRSGKLDMEFARPSSLPAGVPLLLCVP
jgi:hypothetical protein